MFEIENVEMLSGKICGVKSLRVEFTPKFQFGETWDRMQRTNISETLPSRKSYNNSIKRYFF